ncbi:hypothetical protein DYI41_16580 [Marinobacter salarius]|nr:hypothetical protein [Marinobacter salarius]
MQLTLQVYWDFQWHDVGNVVFREPESGLQGAPNFSYHVAYILKALERAGNLEKEDLANQMAIGLNLPCSFSRDYMGGEIAPVLRDIIPQGAARRQWVSLLGYRRDPGQRIDTQLLSLGCVAPIGNVRIKEAADLFESNRRKSSPISFERADISILVDDTLAYMHKEPHLIAGALCAGGDAPKLLLVETCDGRYALEGIVPDAEVVKHWLVKLPRGRKSKSDIEVLEGEAAIYRLLTERGLNSISDAFLDSSGGVVSLWLPRFDRVSTAEGVVRHGVESVYSLMGQIGDGARLSHVDVLTKLRACVTYPAEWDELLVDYLVRDILNTAVGNRDNHGRNIALLKRNFEIELAPAYDIAPMILDPEGIASSTLWPIRFLNHQRNPDYREILTQYADHPESAALCMIRTLDKLVDLKEGLRKHGAPATMLNHPAIRMREPERVLEEFSR